MPTAKSGSRGFIQNLFCKVWTFLQVFTNFGSLPYFLEFKTIRKMIKKCRTVTGLKSAHSLRHSSRRLATRGRPEGWLGHGLAAQPSRRGGLRHAETGRAPCALVVRSSRAAHACAGAVMRSTAARWGLNGGKVLSTSTGGVPGWRRAGGVEAGLTLAAARREGLEQRRRRRGGSRRRG
jgi:hypothetical protein